jgi:ribosomal protein S18 acetylase RimI-like enzyme
MADLERALAFLSLADKGGTRRERFAYGTARFDDRVPLRWDSNFLLVEDAPEHVGAEELAAEADRVQGAAGLRHRKLELRDERLGDRLTPDFKRLGWTVHRTVLMAQQREPDRRPDLSFVQEVDAEALREPRAEQQRTYEWGADPEVAEQLYRAKLLAAEQVTIRFFAVVADGRPVSWTDLYLDGTTAQIEDVATLEPYRGRGYASAVVLRAVDEARRAGTDLIFLLADDEDWPKELYRKLGFDELGRTFEFIKTALEPPRAYFGPSGTNSAGSPSRSNQPTIASWGGFSIP